MPAIDEQTLFNPKLYKDPIDLRNRSHADLLSCLRSMLRIRAVEEAIAELVLNGQAKCPCHLAVGQEAVAVGMSANLQTTDRVFGGHRSHSHFLALRGSVFELVAEVLGRASGCSGGIGGSMHLISLDRGFAGSVPIVAGTASIAAGAALASKFDGSGTVAVCCLGDGATEEGVFHESLNLASVMKLPLIFVVENNLFSSHLDLEFRQPHRSVARFAKAHGVPGWLVDGNDVLAVEDAVAEAVARARRGDGPAIVEAVTFRWYGHVGASEDIDVGVHRNIAELQAWKERDPIRRLINAMTIRGIVSGHDFRSLKLEVEREVAVAVQDAARAPYPPAEALLKHVYAEEVSVMS